MTRALVAYATIVAATAWLADRCLGLDPHRGLPMAPKSQRDLIAGRWS